MSVNMNKEQKRTRLKKKIRAKVFGTSARPRFSVYRSNKFIYAQLINDETGTTLVSASDVLLKTGTKTERAKKVAANLAKDAIAKGVSQVVFDRNGFRYTGRIKLLADEARSAGLSF